MGQPQQSQPNEASNSPNHPAVKHFEFAPRSRPCSCPRRRSSPSACCRAGGWAGSSPRRRPTASTAATPPSSRRRRPRRLSFSGGRRFRFETRLTEPIGIRGLGAIRKWYVQYCQIFWPLVHISGSDLYHKIQVTSLAVSAFTGLPPPFSADFIYGWSLARIQPSGGNSMTYLRASPWCQLCAMPYLLPHSGTNIVKKLFAGLEHHNWSPNYS